ncbi:lysophospholipid acyltransferase family protein [Terrilactibacillus sp. S3-3]|nr:lysophospholipid acyltransferase family protein [Terrilactibacillus sp. S3-3]
MSLYSTGKGLVAVFYKLLFRYEVTGAEHIPHEGGVILCCNHLSNFDPPLVGVALPRDLSFLAKDELFKVPLFGRLIRHLHAFPIRRGTGDRQALKKGLSLLREGHALLIFPEAHRNKTHHLKKGKPAGFFALKSEAAVIPCAIIGSYKPFRPMKVVFDEPLNMAALKARKLRSADVTDVIMSRIQILIDQNTES